MPRTCDNCKRTFEEVGDVARAFALHEEFGVICPSCAEILYPHVLDVTALEAELARDDENLDDEPD